MVVSWDHGFTAQVRSMGARLHNYYPEIGTTLAAPWRCGAVQWGRLWQIGVP